jgi:hypothetical protein
MFFGLLLSTLSMALPEVITMNDPIPWIHPMGYVLGYPVYGLHILVLGGLMYKYSRIGIVTLMSYGGLFGLYEGYLIKQLWNPNWGTELTLQIGGVRVVHTLMLVFFVHSVLAFLVPLVIAELFLARPSSLSRALPFLRSRKGIFVSVIGLAVWLGLIIGSNLPKHGGRSALVAPVISVLVVGTLTAIWVWLFKGRRFSMRELMAKGKGLWILAGLLVVEYVFYSRLLRPEAMPTEWMPHVIVVGMYVFFVTLIILWGRPKKATERPEENVVNASTSPWRLAVAGVCIFLLVAFMHARVKQPGGLIAVISFLGGGAINLVFLVVCFFVGWRRWLRLWRENG